MWHNAEHCYDGLRTVIVLVNPGAGKGTYDKANRDFLRLILAVPVLGLLAAGALLGCWADVSEWILASVSAALVAGGYVLAVAGVARARRGEGTTWFKSSASTRPVRSVSRLPFSTASQALFWIVWRRGGYGLPLMIGLLLPIQLGMLYFADIDPSFARQFLVSILAAVMMMPKSVLSTLQLLI